MPLLESLVPSQPANQTVSALKDDDAKNVMIKSPTEIISVHIIVMIC